MNKSEEIAYHNLFQSIVKNNDRKAIVNIVRELYEIHWVISGNSQIKYYLENILIEPATRQKILLMIIGKLIEDPSEYTMAFLIYLIRKNLFHKLSYIMHIFKYYFAEETNLLLVEVISRYPVDEKILTFYKQKIETINKKKVEFIYKSVPNMLGGFKLRWHEGEIDATLRRRVDKIKDMITKRKV